MKDLMLLAFLFGLTFSNTYAQNSNIKINSGYGLCERIHAGIDYRYRFYSAGFDLGIKHIKYDSDIEQTITATLNNSFYFGKPKKYDLSAWYVNARASYVYYIGNEYAKKVIIFAGGTFGREFNITNKLGVSFDLGLIIPVFHEVIPKNENDEIPFIWIIPYPEANIELFFRL